MIASDLNNPNFAGAMNPDRNLTCEFYSRPVKNEFLSNQEGRPIFADCDFCKIFIPGNNLSVIDTYARQDQKERFPREWANYQNTQQGISQATGTPLDKWTMITLAQAEELKYMKFTTVESIANASDSQLQGLGMKAGMSPYAFRDRARHFLAAFGAETEMAAELDEKKILLETIAKMQAQIEALSVRSPGRPRKSETIEA